MAPHFPLQSIAILPPVFLPILALASSTLAAFLAELRGPDTTNTLRPLHQLLINDAPWILARIKSARVHIAHRRLGANRSLARALRLRLLSEAVLEEVDESLLDVGHALSSQAPPAGAGAAADQDGQQLTDDEIPLERLLADLSPFVGRTAGRTPASARPAARTEARGEQRRGSGPRGSALLFRLLWLLDRQLENSKGVSSDVADGGSGDRRESGQGSVGVWHAERFCQRLKRLPCSIVRVDKIASRFILLEAEALAPCPLEDGGLPDAWRDAQARIDVTNPMRKFESVLVVDEQHNALVVTSALLQLLPLMLAKLADSINRTLGSVLSADSERVLASLLGCESEAAMRHTLAQMHCGNHDTECDEAMQHSSNQAADLEGLSSAGFESDSDLEIQKDGLGRCLVPTDGFFLAKPKELWSDSRAPLGGKIGPMGVKQMSLVSLKGTTRERDQDPDGGRTSGESGAADKHQQVQTGASYTSSRAACLRAGDIVGILCDGKVAGRAQARQAAKSGDGSTGGGAEAEMIAVEVLRFYPHAGLAVVSAVGSEGTDGDVETMGEGWVERVAVVEKELWWTHGDTSSGIKGVGGNCSNAVCDGNASASEEEEDDVEASGVAAGAARNSPREQGDQAPDFIAENDADADQGEGDVVAVAGGTKLYMMAHSTGLVCGSEEMSRKAQARLSLHLLSHHLTTSPSPLRSRLAFF